MKARQSVPVGTARHGVLPVRYPNSRKIVQERFGLFGDSQNEFACRRGWNVTVRIWLKITLTGDEVVEELEGVEIPADRQPRRIEAIPPADKEVCYVAKPPLKLYRLKQIIEAGLHFAENFIIERATDLQQKTLKNLYPTLERLRTYYRQLAVDAAADEREKIGAIEAEYRRRLGEEIQYTRVKATMDLIAVETISTPVLKLIWPLQRNGNSEEVAAVLNLYDGSLISPPGRWVSNDIVLRGSCSRGAVTQEMLIHPDGSVEIPWISPAASKLIMAVWQEITHEPFPVKVISGQLYCG